MLTRLKSNAPCVEYLPRFNQRMSCCFWAFMWEKCSIHGASKKSKKELNRNIISYWKYDKFWTKTLVSFWDLNPKWFEITKNETKHPRFVSKSPWKDVWMVGNLTVDLPSPTQDSKWISTFWLDDSTWQMVTFHHGNGWILGRTPRHWSSLAGIPLVSYIPTRKHNGLLVASKQKTKKEPEHHIFFPPWKRLNSYLMLFICWKIHPWALTAIQWYRIFFGGYLPWHLDVA